MTMRKMSAALAALMISAAGLVVPATAQTNNDFSTVLAPLNGSGTSGTVAIQVDGSEVTVQVETEGASPDLPHAQHIHIGGQNVCPPASAGTVSPPTDLVDTAEGMPFYGAIGVSLTTEGDVSPMSGLAVERFPVAGNDGTYDYERTFELPEGVSASDLVDGVVVVHGISELFGDEAAYDGEPRSSLAPEQFPLEATIPAACGELIEGDTADQPEARDIEDACPPEEIGEAPFDDVDGNTHEEAIACIAAYDITEGTSPDTYSPELAVPRDQMASFIARLIEATDPGALEDEDDGVNAFPCTSNPDDLVEANVHFDAIQLLADAGIVLGGPGMLPNDCYGPDLEVSRAQMASFINQAEEYLGHDIVTDDNYFVDDEGSVHEANINAIASEGIAVGNGNARFLPADAIERDQMASFLARKLDFLADQGDLDVEVVLGT